MGPLQRRATRVPGPGEMEALGMVPSEGTSSRSGTILVVNVSFLALNKKLAANGGSAKGQPAWETQILLIKDLDRSLLAAYERRLD